MSELRELAILSVGLSKQLIKDSASEIIAAVESGELKALDVHVRMKAYESMIKETSTAISNHVRSEAEQYGKSFDFQGAKVELAEVGTKYDFTNCGDKIYDELTAQLTELQAKIKEREALLKTVKSEKIEGDIETGETWTVKPAIKTSTSSVKVTFK